MRHTKYRAFLSTDYEKEERWLNDMSEQGFALVSAGICRYVFEDCKPGEYTYKLELLDSLPVSSKGTDYIRFLEEMGIEHISSILRWVYLRKKSEDGPFDLYSDINSKIRYLKRLRLFFLVLMLSEFAIGFSSLSIAFLPQNGMRLMNVFTGMLVVIIGVILAAASWAHTKKIRLLQRESNIRE
jgi:hypothetical protein